MVSNSSARSPPPPPINTRIRRSGEQWRGLVCHRSSLRTVESQLSIGSAELELSARAAKPTGGTAFRPYQKFAGPLQQKGNNDHPILPAKRADPGMRVWKQELDGLTKPSRQTVGQVQRRVVSSSFDRDDRLPRDANLLPKLVLCPAALHSQLTEPTFHQRLERTKSETNAKAIQNCAVHKVALRSRCMARGRSYENLSNLR